MRKRRWAASDCMEGRWGCGSFYSFFFCRCALVMLPGLKVCRQEEVLHLWTVHMLCVCVKLTQLLFTCRKCLDWRVQSCRGQMVQIIGVLKVDFLPVLCSGQRFPPGSIQRLHLLLQHGAHAQLPARRRRPRQQPLRGPGRPSQVPESESWSVRRFQTDALISLGKSTKTDSLWFGFAPDEITQTDFHFLKN